MATIYTTNNQNSEIQNNENTGEKFDLASIAVQETENVNVN